MAARTKTSKKNEKRRSFSFFSSLTPEKKSAVSDDPFIREIEEMIQKRIDAKRAKDYATADAIRKELADKGVTLIDTAAGTQYTIEQT